jgi:hypothetical protein
MGIVRQGYTDKILLEYEGPLNEAELRIANLWRADLKGADLKGADLKGANLWEADLEGAYLEGAYLEGAYLEGAYLWGADLEGANLKGANLWGVDLKGANLRGSTLDPNIWFPPLQGIWENACDERRRRLLSDLESGDIAYGSWEEGTIECPERILLGKKGTGDLFTIAWDTHGIPTKTLLEKLEAL